MIYGMKIKLLELQSESLRLQNLKDERNSANILMSFSSRDSIFSCSSSHDTLILPDADDTSSIVSGGGDIVEQLRLSVQEEIHLQNVHLHKRIRRDAHVTWLEENSVNIDDDDMVTEMDALDSDHEDNDMDHTYQPLPQSTINWRTSIVVNAQGIERRLTGGELYQFRKDRNRIHAKMTRDRKKLFFSRMQTLITTLEIKNETIRQLLGCLIDHV